MNPVSARQKIGLVLAALLSLGSLPSVFSPTPDGEVGPPFVVLALSSVLGVVGLVAVAFAWTGNNAALRIAAGALVIGVVTTLPAFFVDIPTWLKLASAATVLAAVLALVLMFSPARRPAPVLD